MNHIRLPHIIGGIAVFSLGIFLFFMNSAVVIETLKGSTPLLFIVLGLTAFVAVFTGNKDFKWFNGFLGAILTFLGLYGLYDAYYAVLDFLRGFYPLLFLVIGFIAAVSSVIQKDSSKETHPNPLTGIFEHLALVLDELRIARSKKEPYIKQGLIGGVIGNVLEWYDFAVFGFFAPVIATQFFPSQDRLLSLLSTYGVFAGAYFMRPVGGIIFGYIGDKYGRKKALQISVIMMAIPTALIGLLPTHAQIGSMAALLLVLLRLAQGLSVGGELIGSISFITEISPPDRKGFYGSLTFCSVTAGIMLGSLVAAITTNSIDTIALQTWGWRVPFIAGILIGFLGLYMRSNLSETPEFEEMQKDGEIRENPVADVLRSMPYQVFQVAALIALSGGGFYLLFVWWPTFLATFISPPVPQALLLNTISMILLMVLVPITGAISDKTGRRAMLIIGAFGIAITALPMFLLIGKATMAGALIIQLIFTVFISIFMGPVPAVMMELFPADMRYSGAAVGNNISICLFGGTAPLIATWIMAKTGSITAPAWYLIAMAVISLGAALSLKKSAEIPGK